MILSNSIAVLPEHVISNNDLIKIFKLNFEARAEIELSRMAGVYERRYFDIPLHPTRQANGLPLAAAPKAANQFSAQLSEVALRFIERQQLQNLDMLVHCSTTPCGVSPATAHRLHHLAELPSSTHCLDLMSSCSSFLSAFRMCEAVVNDSKLNCLIIASETKSQHIEAHDKITAGIFADGCGAYYLNPDPLVALEKAYFDRFYWVEPYVDSSLAPNIVVERCFEKDFLKISNGKLMYRKTVQAFSDMVERCQQEAARRNLHLSTVYMHQANAHILAEVRRKFPDIRLPILISDIGNLVSASMPVHRLRCLLLDSLFVDFERLGYLQQLFDRKQAFDLLDSHAQKFSLRVDCFKESGLLFVLNSSQEKVTLYDAAARKIEDSWLARISEEEWRVYFEDCVRHIGSGSDLSRGKAALSGSEQILDCDAWIVAGGGFQALGLLHHRIH